MTGFSINKLEMIIRTDTKETVWYRRFYTVPDGTPVEKIIADIENGDIDSFEGEYLLDTSVDMRTEDNDGNTVFEIYNDDKLLYSK